MFYIRDGCGTTYNKVKNPVAVYDKESFTLLKIGEKEVMEDYYNKLQMSYRDNGFHEQADCICMMDLPREQEEIDKVFQISGYIEILLKKHQIN